LRRKILNANVLLVNVKMKNKYNNPNCKFCSRGNYNDWSVRCSYYEDNKIDRYDQYPEINYSPCEMRYEEKYKNKTIWEKIKMWFNAKSS